MSSRIWTKANTSNVLLGHGYKWIEKAELTCLLHLPDSIKGGPTYQSLNMLYIEHIECVGNILTSMYLRLNQFS